jgi:hypothetical protein
MPATRIMGVTANMADIEDKTIGEGRFMTEGESNPCHIRHALVGWDVKDKFFP